MRVRGTVQGVGFRPAAYRLAVDLGLGGFVRNDTEGLWIEIEGAPDRVVQFLRRLVGEQPPLGRISTMDVVEMQATGEDRFSVVSSAARERVEAIVPADAATCDDCLHELFNPKNRRHRYPFISCTSCGPRYTIARDVPYDRERTTASAYRMCPECRAEYEDPANRRFRSVPNGCPACGPRLAFEHVDAAPLAAENALAAAIAGIAAGRVVAVKGVGGFHLVADARNDGAVARLREAKHRPHKPFAVMVRTLEDAERIVVLDPRTREALTSRARPIVLVPPRPDNGLSPAIAPRLRELGVMLAGTALDHLLLASDLSAIVMTSGNRPDQPIARTDQEARTRLAGVADAFLLHDREIHTRAEDSVLRTIAGDLQVVRRSRGYVPDPIGLGVSAPPICAVGAARESTVCLTRGDQAVMSPRLGQLESAETYGCFTEVIDKLGRLLSVDPAFVAHDLDPEYVSTRWAVATGQTREPVQHHHAHIASCLVDNGHAGPVLGVAFDGAGCAPAGDGSGGEILRADLVEFSRVARLRPIPLPGGKAAIKEPWRLAIAALVDAGAPLDVLARIPAEPRNAIAQLCARSPRVSGAARWFDAVAALCGVRDEVSYDGQAAVELEALAAPGEARPYPFDIEESAGKPDLIDLRPMIRRVEADVREGVRAPFISARFHQTLAAAIQEIARRWCGRLEVGTVALSGGCFQNRLLTEATKELLERDGLRVLVHRRVPANDAGVALGQAAVAAHRWGRRTIDRRLR